MSSTSDTIRLVLLAFTGGLALPLAVQLFLTLRSLQRTAQTIDRRLDETARDLHEVLAGLRREPAGGGGDVGALLASAAVPAVMAAVRAFRSSASVATAPNGATSPTHLEKTS